MRHWLVKKAENDLVDAVLEQVDAGLVQWSQVADSLLQIVAILKIQVTLEFDQWLVLEGRRNVRGLPNASSINNASFISNA